MNGGLLMARNRDDKRHFNDDMDDIIDLDEEMEYEDDFNTPERDSEVDVDTEDYGDSESEDYREESDSSYEADESPYNRNAENYDEALYARDAENYDEAPYDRASEPYDDEPYDEDYDEDYDDEPGRRKRIDLANLPWWVHAAILGTIALIIGASAWALYRWNTGEKITFTQTDDMSQYETERLDNVFYLTSEDLEGHVDDGVNTILCLGNDAFTYNSGDKGLASRIAALTDSTVYNAAFPLSCVSLRTATYDSSYPMDLFSFYNVTQAMVSGDFSDMEAAAAAMDDSTYSQSVDVLQNIDMDSVDMIVIMYDAQDYLNQRAGRDFNDADNPITFMGAYHAGLTALREAFPYIRIVVMSHTLCYAYTSEGVVSGDTYDFGNGALPTYLQHIIDTCEELGVTFVDNYYGTVDESNSSELLVDTIHLSDDCVELIAEHFKELLFGE
ncbi:MAG: hypothetical protein E7309_04780 [Butyrivibrio sp.]|nr:hypothetical protein [Butyrivibrio sp.]